MNQPLTQQRLRITFSKHGPIRFIGHLDLSKNWERVLRRAQIPLEYSQGFNPRPRMQFAAALPVGVTSDSEYLDIWLTKRLGGLFPDEWIARLNAASPEGLRVVHLDDVAIKTAALPTLVTHADYVITLLDAAVNSADWCEQVAALLAAADIPRVRNKKAYDLRPLILGLVVAPDGSILAQLAAGEQHNGRPDELLDALGIDLAQARIHRRCLYLNTP